MSRPERALEAFLAGFSCAQAVFTAWAGEAGIPADLSNRIATAFGAGCARRSLTCGAVSGAFLAIGLRHGMADAADDAARETVYEKTNAFCRRFEERHGSTQCGILLGCDLATEDGQATFRDNDYFRSRCTVYVRDACEILDGMGV